MLALILVFAQVTTITVNALGGSRPISPWIYGRNNSLSDRPDRPTTAAAWQLYRDAGVTMFRESGGNNSTKYNWRRKLTSHPDWYNNVYAHDWDYAAQSLQTSMPAAQGMWTLPLIGKAASNTTHNFNDWGYNGSQWWEGVGNNWAGGGGPTQGTGNPNLYLEDWPPEQSVGILDHWFGPAGLGLDPSGIRYWNMDNEPEIWNGTHDDVMPTMISAEAFMQRYFDVAKRARALYPDIKLVGPVPANEWQWFNWDGNKIDYKGNRFTWLEYFIKRIGEEQRASGIRLLDVLDVHFYPGETQPEDIVQLHRVWFDTSYDYPGANGLRRLGPGDWNPGPNREYILKRVRDWMTLYLLPGHGVGLGVTEIGINGNDPNVTAVWYASTLGTFADEGVELFTPWTWKTGMWEVLHLFSRYAHDTRVETTSTDRTMISAYASMRDRGGIPGSRDSLTVILVNRYPDTRSVTVNLAGIQTTNSSHETLELSHLPSDETFRSHEDNALVRGTVMLGPDCEGADEHGYDCSFSTDLPGHSVTAVRISGIAAVSIADRPVSRPSSIALFPDPATGPATIRWQGLSRGSIEVLDVLGRRVAEIPIDQTDGSVVWTDPALPAGVYFLRGSGRNWSVGHRFTLFR